jgi:outer membrane protein OmpA-like peptidoglycan-associated protein
LVPGILGAIANKGATSGGASNLMSLINGANLDVNSLGNLGSLFAGGSVGANELLKIGSSSLVPALFGDKAGALVSALSSSSGINTSSSTNLIAMAVPLVLSFLKKFITERGLNANSLSSLLASQGPSLQGALDSRITSALGFGSPSALVNSLSGAAGATADAARRAGGAVVGGVAAAGNAAYTTGATAAAATKPAFQRFLPWLIVLAILALLWFLFGPKVSSPPPAPAATPAVAPATTMPAPAFSGFPAKVYFDSGSATVGPDGTSVISAAATAIKKDNVKVVVTGYTDKSGDPAKNEELAKNRAAAVRDALKAAGIAEGDIDMKPPLFVEQGVAADSAEARRVEINKQ